MCRLMCAFLIILHIALVGFWTPVRAHMERDITGLRLAISVLVSLCAIVRGYQKRSLSRSGAVTALALGVLVASVNWIFAISVIAFFSLGSKATHRRVDWAHRHMPQLYKPQTRRTWVQVVCNGGLLGILALLQMGLKGSGENEVDWNALGRACHKGFSTCILGSLGDEGATTVKVSWLHLLALGTVACAAGDTLASELAPVCTRRSPVLIAQPWRRVPIGTNGGVTIMGLGLSLVGGLAIGLVDLIATLALATETAGSERWRLEGLWPLVGVGAVAGLIGSLYDSLLGATLQFSGVDLRTHRVVDAPGPHVKRISGWSVLNNHLVNLFAGILTTLTIPVVLGAIVFPRITAM